jgi:hypothetical protein
MKPGKKQFEARGKAHLTSQPCSSVIKPIRVHSCLSAVKKSKKTSSPVFCSFLRFFATPRIPRQIPRSEFHVPSLNKITKRTHCVILNYFITTTVYPRRVRNRHKKRTHFVGQASPDTSGSSYSSPRQPSNDAPCSPSTFCILPSSLPFSRAQSCLVEAICLSQNRCPLNSVQTLHPSLQSDLHGLRS